jgi:site-specific DNA-methyltransferase (adenine-specific)
VKAKIHTGDCIPWLRSLEPGSVDLVFADPPFNIGYEYDEYSDRRKPADYLHWCGEWILAAADTLKPGGAFWLAIGDDYAAELCITLKRCGLTMRNWVIWHYTFGVHLTAKFGRCKTHMLYFTKGKPAYFEPERIESERQRMGDKRANPAGRVPGDVWTFSRVCGTFKERTGHPCQMPLGPMERIIQACCPPGGLVIDPFAGSGTTLDAAQRCDRRSMGCELSPAYAKLARNRLISSSSLPAPEAD